MGHFATHASRRRAALQHSTARGRLIRSVGSLCPGCESYTMASRVGGMLPSPGRLVDPVIENTSGAARSLLGALRLRWRRIKSNAESYRALRVIQRSVRAHRHGGIRAQPSGQGGGVVWRTRPTLTLHECDRDRASCCVMLCRATITLACQSGLFQSPKFFQYSRSEAVEYRFRCGHGWSPSCLEFYSRCL